MTLEMSRRQLGTKRLNYSRTKNQAGPKQEKKNLHMLLAWKKKKDLPLISIYFLSLEEKNRVEKKSCAVLIVSV